MRERNVQNLILGMGLLAVLAMATMSSVSRKDVEVREPKMRAFPVAGALLCDDSGPTPKCVRLPQGSVLLIPEAAISDSSRAK